MNIRKCFLLTLFGSGMAQADTIRVNFVDASAVDDMLAAGVAGWPDPAGTHVANWNNAQAGTTGEPSPSPLRAKATAASRGNLGETQAGKALKVA